AAASRAHEVVDGADADATARDVLRLLTHALGALRDHPEIKPDPDTLLEAFGQAHALVATIDDDTTAKLLEALLEQASDRNASPLLGLNTFDFTYRPKDLRARERRELVHASFRRAHAALAHALADEHAKDPDSALRVAAATAADELDVALAQIRNGD